MDKTIPKDWEAVKLGDERYFEIIMGQSPPSSTYNQDQKGLPFYQGNADFGYLTPTARLYCSSPQKIAEAGDVLISVRAPVGEVNITNHKCCIGRGVTAIRPKNKNNLYLFYYLTYLKNTWVRERTTFEAIKRVHIDNKQIAWPPAEEQQKIAEVLSTIDESIQKVDGAIEKTKRLKQGLMQELLTKGIGHKELKNTEIGRIPKEWEVLKIKDVGNVATGKTPSTFNKNFWGGNIPFITPGDIKYPKYVYDTERHVTSEGANKVGILPKNVVLVVCIGSTIGKVGMTYQNSITNQQINSVICTENVNPHYIYYALFFRSYLIKSYSGVAAVPIIKKSLFEQFKLATPKDVNEQQKIADILSATDEKIELERKRKGILEKIKKGLMEDLLAGRKRVITE